MKDKEKFIVKPVDIDNEKEKEVSRLAIIFIGESVEILRKKMEICK